jgi:solute carrier family 7 (L-type amino acid transporter), member 5
MPRKNAADLPSPTVTEMALVSPDTESVPPLPEDHVEGTGKVKMKKELGLLEGCAIILGIILGSGIFISPKGVIQEVNAVGTSLVIWVLCGVLSMIGALCYAELGTALPVSGGDYAYINEAYGSLPAFLYLWDATVIFVPSTNAIMGLTVASYILQPFYDEDCQIPLLALQLLAAVMICFLTFLNSFTVKATTKMQNVFMFTKVGALVIIIIVGVFWMCSGESDSF